MRTLKFIRLACVVGAYSLVFVTDLVDRTLRVVLLFLAAVRSDYRRVIEVLDSARRETRVTPGLESGRGDGRLSGSGHKIMMRAAPPGSEQEGDKTMHMKSATNADGVWYHGSDKVFTILRESSTVTQWRELAEAFSHQPSVLSYDDDGKIHHDGTKKGYLYVINEPVQIGEDIYQHPRTAMDQGLEFLTRRPLTVRLIREL